MALEAKLYPKNARQGFDGGKNSKYSKELIADNESPDCQNVIFENGAVETRGGTRKFNTATVGSYVGDGLYTRHDRSGAESMCAFFGGMLFVNSGTSFYTVPSAQSVFTAGVRVGAAEYENYIFFGNGNVNPYKYNGDFTRHGVPAPTTTMTVASGATGSLTGKYIYAVTYVNSALVESDPSPLTLQITFASATASITSVPIAPQSFGVNSRRLYRTVNSGTTLLRVATINDNTTSIITDSLADASLGVAAPDDNGEPPNYSAIITHQNRLFCNDTANPNLVWYSELATPYTFGATNFISIGDNSGDLVKGFEIYDNGLVVFSDRAAYMVYMPSTDPTEWVTVKLRSSYGSRSPFGSFSYNNKVMFPAVQGGKLVGFAAISGDAVDPEATLLTVSAAGSDMKSDRIEPDVFLLQSSTLGNISSMVYKNRGYITVTYGDGNTINNRIYVFDFSISNLNKKQEASWVPWTGLSAAQFTEFGGKLYYISSTATGYVFETNVSGLYSDNGLPIDSYLWTKEFSGQPGDGQDHKDFRYINLLYEKAGGYFMDVNYRVDSDTGVGNLLSVDLDPGGSLWGSMVWGVDSWGGGNENGEERLYLGQFRGKRVQFRFSNQNTINQKFKVIGLQFGYNSKGRR